jgi:L,D-peptidoglycan transpeptidase YkuD (ErfK/YbiS/YcfS/YnhG family)
MEFVVRASPDGTTTLDWGDGARRCAVGHGGIGIKWIEGDNVTPIGIWPIRNVFYRPDRVAMPETPLAVSAIASDDGWCDAPDDPNYNRLVKLPYAADHEVMWRHDHLYDLVAVLGFNDDPVIPGRGSAIFLHVASPAYGATAGCVALALADLQNVLRLATPGSTVRIEA